MSKLGSLIVFQCFCYLSLAQMMQKTTLDFSNAKVNPETGGLCIMQEVCIDDVAALATASGVSCPQALDPGCDCQSDEECGGGSARYSGGAKDKWHSGAKYKWHKPDFPYQMPIFMRAWHKVKVLPRPCTSGSKQLSIRAFK